MRKLTKILPHLEAEWNDPLTVAEALAVKGVRYRAYWKCKKCGYEWFQSIQARKYYNCAMCAGNLTNALNHPEISLIAQIIGVDRANAWEVRRSAKKPGL